MSFTQFITFFLIGAGLSFDSFAVSVSCGLMKKEIRFNQAVPIAFSLAFFQAVFPAIGWLSGKSIHDIISPVDHWIAFGLLAFLGIKMIIEGIKPCGALQKFDPFRKRVIIGLSVATSIDALVVGLSFGLLQIPILFPVTIIGAVTFIASMLGMLFGKKISAEKSRKSLILGGIILTGIGVKILLEHIFL
ncbi:Putative Mn2+ efflux pump MntP [Mariniphaga anaerophila]|uniref:Putative manganese efflux pump MntP n=1 Tax=Mariniphaga anaerophila TaxID=1484053 RepID=A0A1M5CHA3_9BACT|nr:manganese efflux pump MntP family protein [Mariniphaga anaerophila]SHF53977.1 Putative Mn2+ efflux pump MntP [Mariniphaga anaerophila]